MIPRKKIDIGFPDLAAAAVSCLLGGEAGALEDRINSAWPSEVRIVPFLSVRSGFDATLEALRLPPGSEVLVSALTIRDMERIILEHGLVPVPVDLDMTRLDVEISSLAEAVTERTKAVLIAHLFGSRMRMDPIVDFARARGLLVFEDCAQAFVGRGYQGDPRCDVRMFSFGPIKTATALGGGLFFFRDSALRESTEAIQYGWARKGQFDFLKRVLKYGLISCLGSRFAYRAFVVVCGWLGTDHEQVLGKSVRGFAGSDLFPQIRRRPSRALLALLARRLERFDPRRIEKRRLTANALMDRLPEGNRLGNDAYEHSHWVFPILSEEPDRLVKFLWARGFDGTRGQSSLVVVACPNADARKPVKAIEAYGKLLYLPVSGDLCGADAVRILDALGEFSKASPAVSPPIPML